jgi:SAM-dependent methyltransferase
MSLTRCAICSGEVGRRVLLLEGLPVFANIQYPTREMALDQPTGTIDLHFCPICEHFYNAVFVPELLRYGGSYENSLHFSPTFSAFARELAEDLVSRLSVRSSRVVDIGCGKGDFLRLICEIGDNEGFGFDSSYEPSRENGGSGARVHFQSRFFGAGDGRLDPQLVTCRQVLEHIENPVEFLREIVAALQMSREPMFYLEVPNALFTLRDFGIWDLIYEHCNYFTAASFVSLAKRAGLNPTRITETFGGQYLSLEAVRAPSEASIFGLSELHLGCSGLAAAFAGRFFDLLDRWRAELAELTQQGPAVVWGAGSKGVTFVNLLQAGERIAALVDINPYKQGRYVAGTGHPVISPEGLAGLGCSTVLVMNPLYMNEVQEKISACGSDATVVSVT